MVSINISSLRNPLIKEYKKLSQSRTYRHKANKLALEGPNQVREALKAGIVPHVIFYTQNYYDSSGNEWLSELPAAVPRAVVTETVFKGITDTETPQAVAAVIPFSMEKNENLFEELPRLILILDRLSDPGNMGTIIRTAAAAEVGLICYTPGSVDPFSPKVIRSSAGTIFNLAVEMISEPVLQINAFKKKGMKIVVASTRSPLQLWSADLKGPIVLVIGNETDGIAPEVEAAAEIMVSIPLPGSVDSLNAAVATGVILFEIIRQHRT